MQSSWLIPLLHSHHLLFISHLALLRLCECFLSTACMTHSYCSTNELQARAQKFRSRTHLYSLPLTPTSVSLPASFPWSCWIHHHSWLSWTASSAWKALARSNQSLDSFWDTSPHFLLHWLTQLNRNSPEFTFQHFSDTCTTLYDLSYLFLVAGFHYCIYFILVPQLVYSPV